MMQKDINELETIKKAIMFNPNATSLVKMIYRDIDEINMRKDELIHIIECGMISADIRAMSFEGFNSVYFALLNQIDELKSFGVNVDEYIKKLDTILSNRKKFIAISEDIDDIDSIDITKYDTITPKQYYKNKTKKHFKGDIIITDPCYVIKDSNNTDWELSGYGENMECLGITEYVSSDTIVGDWSCEVFDIGNKTIDDICNAKSNKFKMKSIGEFCADAGMVAVFDLNNVLKYNPDFDYYITKKHTTTLIRAFDGDIEIIAVEVIYNSNDKIKSIKRSSVNKDGKVVITDDTAVMVIGTGNVNFISLMGY